MGPLCRQPQEHLGTAVPTLTHLHARTRSLEPKDVSYRYGQAMIFMLLGGIGHHCRAVALGTGFALHFQLLAFSLSIIPPAALTPPPPSIIHIINNAHNNPVALH